MKVLFTSAAVASEVNGEFYSTNICTHVQKYCYFGDVITCCHNKIESSTKLQKVTGTKLEIFPKENTLKRLLTLKRQNKAHMEELVKSVDFVIAHVPGTLSNYAIKYAIKYNKPYISIVVGCAWDALWNYDLRGKFMAPTSYLKLRNIVSHSKYTLYVTQKFLQERYPCKYNTEYASNVSIDKTDKAIIEKKYACIQQSSGERINLATSAAINVRYKGQEDVIKAISILNKQEGPKYYYYLLGGGDKTYLENLAKKYGVAEYVIFMGFVAHNDVFTFLDEKVEVYIQPSKQEGLPRALIEALSRGIPSLGSSVAGIPELLEESHLFKAGDVNQIVDRLKKFTKEERLKAVNKNYEKSLEYTRDVLNERRNKFFDKFLHEYFH